MHIISQNIQDEVIQKFAMKMSIPPPSTIKVIVGGKIFKTIQTTHIAATSTKQREQQSIMLVQQDSFDVTHDDPSLSSQNNDHFN